MSLSRGICGLVLSVVLLHATGCDSAPAPGSATPEESTKAVEASKDMSKSVPPLK